MEVVGSVCGSVWGSGAYSDDSDLGTAAVHSGLVQPGEVKFVCLRFLPARGEFAGSTSNGSTSNAYGAFSGAYEILGSGIRHTEFPPNQPGTESVNVVVVGNNTQPADGTDIYTSLSNLGAAAVHCGLLEPGEVGLLRVEQPGLDEYEPSTQNGVTTLYYGHWAESIRLHRLY